MSKVQAIEIELQKLSRKEMRQLRDWLDAALNGADTGDLRSEIGEGIKQVKARKLSPFDELAVTRIKSRGRRILRQNAVACSID